jgi:crotonobetainyl-CoA:carnitine CoA-transferase CaiB-like acyl-CoA transferase
MAGGLVHATTDPGSPLGRAWEGLVMGARPAEPPGWVEIKGPRGRLPSNLPVEEAAAACVALALLAGRGLHRLQVGTGVDLTVDRAQLATAFRSERYFRRGDSSAGVGFAPLSRFWPTADGWIRTHANYPWHRDALLGVLGTGSDGREVEKALAGWGAKDVEEAAFAAGGVAAAVRTPDEWNDHAQGRAIAGEPLISHRVMGNAPPRPHGATGVSGLPAAGIRVLDMTRVIAGPVCTRFLAALGAEVLRLDPPARPDLVRGQPSDTLLGKRSALTDLESPAGAGILHRLLATADVVVCGYRPGSLDRFGLTEDELAERYPGLVVLYLSAWGFSGPWAGRRGFDSIVQAPTGIARIESADGRVPGALPCQLLDHGTGYLGAAAVLDGLRRQGEGGGTHVRRVSLARTAHWLTSGAFASPRDSAEKVSPAAEQEETEADRWLVDRSGPHGPVRAVGPPGQINRRPLQWPARVPGYGDDAPTWA